MVRQEMTRRLVFDLILAIIAGVLFGLTLTYPKAARFVPLIIVTPTFGLALGRLIYDLSHWWRMRREAAYTQGGEGSEDLRGEVAASLWVLLFFAMVYLLGFIVSIPLYIFASMRFRSREPWLVSVLVPLGAWAFMYGLFGWFLKVQLFEGILFQ